MRKLRLLTCSAAHFCVDFSCAFLLFRALHGRMDATALFLLYNFCAFALQMPLGLLADRWNQTDGFSAAGCALVLLAFPLCGFVPVCAVCLGLGNALFHVGGGLRVMRDSGDCSAPLGVFVSPGAAGIVLGTMAGKGGTFPLWIAALALALLAGLFFLSDRRQKTGRFVYHPPFSLEGIGSPRVLLPAAALFLVVVLRSILGLSASFSWKGDGNGWLFAMLAVVLGKAAGGFLSDWMGMRRAALLSLLPASVLFLFADSPVAGTLALFFFNMTMPLTLSALAQRMPGCKGFSFGLLTFALFFGSLPALLGLTGTLPLWSLAALSLLSCALLAPAVQNRDRLPVPVAMR